ncbi:8215_t:CDS:2 [Entrophospora sp. SA101]|nr:8215_t:CDS:2 [Entrophospora sp. SA101]
MEVIPVPKEFKCRNNHCIKERDKYLTPHKLDNIYCYLLGGDIMFDSVGGRSSNNRDKIGKPPSKFKGGSFQVKIPNSSD